MNRLSGRRPPIRLGARKFLIGGLVLVLTLIGGTALASELVDDDIYRLPQGEVIDDDLVVFGREVIINGTVNGDLVAAAAHIEVNGVIAGDLIAAGAEIRINGVVQDDARVAGGSIQLNGNVADDLFAAGGGFWPGTPAIPIRVAGRSIALGIDIAPSAKVGGDAYLTGGKGSIAGDIHGDLFVSMDSVMFGGSVGGDADINANSITVSESAQVAGDLRYTSGDEAHVPADSAGSVTAVDPARVFPDAGPSPLVDFSWWLLRTAMILLGTGLVGALIWRFAPNWLVLPAEAIQAQPAESGLYGILLAVAVIPVSAALVFLAILFWGWFPGGVVMFAFLFGLFSLGWLLSPIITGLWLGRWLTSLVTGVHGDLNAMLIGMAVIVLAARVLGAVPCVGVPMSGIILLLSFALAAGGMLLSGRTSQLETTR